MLPGWFPHVPNTDRVAVVIVCETQQDAELLLADSTSAELSRVWNFSFFDCPGNSSSCSQRMGSTLYLCEFLLMVWRALSTTPIRNRVEESTFPPFALPSIACTTPARHAAMCDCVIMPDLPRLPLCDPHASGTASLARGPMIVRCLHTVTIEKLAIA